MYCFQARRDIHRRKTEEARRFPEAGIGEERALAIVELEKQKSRAAIQAAQMAQRLAELEAQKRKKNAELKAKREAEARRRSMDNLPYRRYTIEDIEVATDYFSNSLKIGEGGYGPVYKATLDHTPVAIKVLRPDVSQGLQQFKKEVCMPCSLFV